MEPIEAQALSLLKKLEFPYSGRYHKKRKEKLITFIEDYGRSNVTLLTNHTDKRINVKNSYKHSCMLGRDFNTQKYIWAVVLHTPIKTRRYL